MRISAALFALASLLLAVALPARASRIDSMKKLTVLVTNEGFLGGGRGSGVLLNATHVLTCAHMADGLTNEFFVYTYPLGVVVKAHIESVNLPADLMLLKLDSPVPTRTKPVFQAEVRDGERIVVVGNALGAMKWYVTTGVISGRERDYLMTDAPVNQGNSGGPWFNEKGEIVALSDWGIQRAEGVNGGVSARTVLQTMYNWAHPKKLMDILMGVGK